MNPKLINLKKELRIKGKCCICKKPATAMLDLKSYCSKCYAKVFWEKRCKRELIKSQDKTLRNKLRYLTETKKHRFLIKQQKELKWKVH